VPTCYKMRYKLVFLSLALVVLGTGCSNEIKKKNVAGHTASKDVCADDATRDNQFFCLSSAVKVDCSQDVNSTACTKDKFINDGYGGFAYPLPIVTFFNNMYSQYVNQYFAVNKILPAYVHFGEYFGLLYDEKIPATNATLADVHPDLLPVGIVDGGTISSAGTSTGAVDGIAYKSESCALCHLGIANDGFYRFGVPNNHLKYGGLKLAFNRFICYAEAKDEYAGLDTKCAVTLSTLSDADQELCNTYTAFRTSSGNASLLAIWQNTSLFPTDARAQLLGALQNSVQGAESACDAVGKMLPPYDHKQVVELSKWDGIHYPDGSVIVDTEASRIDRFYHSVMTANGTPRTTINDGVHAPVKIPLLGNLVPTEAAAAGDYRGEFLASGMVSSLPQYVRLHAALEGGDNSVGMDDATLAPLLQFIAGIKLPVSDVATSTLESDAYKTGKTLFVERGCAVCHDESYKLIDYVVKAATDFTYATALVAPNVSPRTVQSDIKALTPIDVWNDALTDGLVFSSLKQPRLQGLWTARSFLHNGMSQSLANLFCLSGTTALEQRVAKNATTGVPIYAAPFLDSGHEQTCAADLTIEQRQDLITYILTL